MRAGLLLANSTFVDRLAGDIRQCVGKGLKDGGLEDHELIIETSSYNNSAKVVSPPLQDLMIKQDVDVVVAPLNPSLFAAAAAVAKGQQVPLIALTMGEDVFEDDLAPPWLFANSFSMWRSCWLTGYLSAKRFGPAICIVSAAHDGAYGLNPALESGISAGGGELIATLPMPLFNNLDAVTNQVADIKSLAPDAILVMATGTDLQIAHQAVQNALPEAPIVSIPPTAFGVEGHLPGVIGNFESIVSSFNPTDSAAVTFLDWFVPENDRPAPAYAILAYEAGLMLAQSAQNCEGAPRGKRLRDALSAVSISGPRGEVAFDPVGQEVETSQWILNAQQSPNDGCSVVSSTPAEIPDRLITDHALARSSGEKTGWTNPYLIA